MNKRRKKIAIGTQSIKSSARSKDIFFLTIWMLLVFLLFCSRILKTTIGNRKSYYFSLHEILHLTLTFESKMLSASLLILHVILMNAIPMINKTTISYYPLKI